MLLNLMVKWLQRWFGAPRSQRIDIFHKCAPTVDEVGAEIVKKYGIEKLSEIAKVNFKNTEKIKNL